jgi:hypothetical protein
MGSRTWSQSSPGSIAEHRAASPWEPELARGSRPAVRATAYPFSRILAGKERSNFPHASRGGPIWPASEGLEDRPDLCLEQGQVLANGQPDRLHIDPHVVVDEFVPHAGDVLPRHRGIG